MDHRTTNHPKSHGLDDVANEVDPLDFRYYFKYRIVINYDWPGNVNERSRGPEWLPLAISGNIGQRKEPEMEEQQLHWLVYYSVAPEVNFYLHQS